MRIQPVRRRSGRFFVYDAERTDHGQQHYLQHRRRPASVKEPLMNAKIFPLTVEVDENIPSPQEKGDREAVEEVLAGRGIAPYGEFLKEEGIRGKKANTKQRTVVESRNSCHPLRALSHKGGDPLQTVSRHRIKQIRPPLRKRPVQLRKNKAFRRDCSKTKSP